MAPMGLSGGGSAGWRLGTASEGGLVAAASGAAGLLAVGGVTRFFDSVLTHLLGMGHGPVLGAQ